MMHVLMSNIVFAQPTEATHGTASWGRADDAEEESEPRPQRGWREEHAELLRNVRRQRKMRQRRREESETAAAGLLHTK